MGTFQPIFCCPSAVQTNASIHHRRFRQENRDLHEVMYESFMEFIKRRYKFLLYVTTLQNLGITMPTPHESESLAAQSRDSPFLESMTPRPILTPAALWNNRLTPEIPFVMYVICRKDWGPTLSHRYFVCPPPGERLSQDWREISHEQWFAAGYPLRAVADSWEFQCPEEEHNYYFRLELRANTHLLRDFGNQVWAT